MSTFRKLLGIQGPRVISTSGKSGTGGGNQIYNLVNVPPGALILVTWGCEAAQTSTTVSSAPTLAWTSRLLANTQGTSGTAQLFTTTFPAGGSVTVTVTGNVRSGSAVYVITGQEGTLNGASATAENQNPPSVNISTTKPNSLIIAIACDFNAIAGTAAYVSLPVVQSYDDFVSGGYHAWHWYKKAMAKKLYTMGMTTPVGVSSGVCLYEVRGK